MSNLQVIEWTGVLFGVLSVIYAVLGNKLTWPIGIISCIAYFYFHYDQKYYFSMGLQAFYIITCIGGWMEWHKKNPSEEKGVSNVPLWHYGIYIPAIAIGTLVMGYFLDIKTDDPKPYLDTFATVLSVLGQWFLIRRYLENWLVWVVADSVYCYLFFVQENLPSLLLFLVYLVFAIVGYFQWKKMQQEVR
ncbi:MAG: nicotinamide riboside transporter PnuC [Cytophagaceae bacterium]|jgi:nicotinamide mononucleotide transporter|nr:nicotinamide riboside transporter PnuC [Cytophagaceae bacterium]